MRSLGTWGRMCDSSLHRSRERRAEPRKFRPRPLAVVGGMFCLFLLTYGLILLASALAHH